MIIEISFTRSVAIRSKYSFDA